MSRFAIIILCIGLAGCWLSIPDFPGPTPTPEPTPTPSPEPEPTPSPSVICGFPQGLTESEHTGRPATSVNGTVLNEVMAEITGCSIGSRCFTGKSPQEWMRVVVLALCERGIRAGQGYKGHTDEINVLVDEEVCRWEGYHITTHSPRPTVVWSPNAMRPCWRIPVRYCRNQPTDPGDCPLPLPDPNFLKINLSFHNDRWDATPIVFRSCAFCEEIGLGTHGGQIRCGCPVRPDGHDERSACEQFVMGGQPRWFCNDVEIEATEDNLYQAFCSGRVKVCNSNLSVCTSKER